jgi:hypothetical protein
MSDSNGLSSRRPLSGLTTTTPSLATEWPKLENKAERSPSTPLSPGRHTRIPSTGNRATVMDVVQAWNETPVSSPSAPVDVETVAPQHEDMNEAPEMIEKLAEAIPQRRLHMTPPNGQAEKRKSSYERYSAIILPSLPEEKTPLPTPMNTLTRSGVQDQRASATMPVEDLVHFGELYGPPSSCSATDHRLHRSHR